MFANVENYSTIARTLNAAYTTSYSGLRDAYTTYPVSAFITHLVYLEGTNIEVDTRAITVRHFKQDLSRTHTLIPLGRQRVSHVSKCKVFERRRQRLQSLMLRAFVKLYSTFCRMNKTRRAYNFYIESNEGPERTNRLY